MARRRSGPETRRRTETLALPLLPSEPTGVAGLGRLCGQQTVQASILEVVAPPQHSHSPGAADRRSGQRGDNSRSGRHRRGASGRTCDDGPLASFGTAVQLLQRRSRLRRQPLSTSNAATAISATSVRQSMRLSEYLPIRPLNSHNRVPITRVQFSYATEWVPRPRRFFAVAALVVGLGVIAGPAVAFAHS